MVVELTGVEVDVVPEVPVNLCAVLSVAVVVPSGAEPPPPHAVKAALAMQHEIKNEERMIGFIGVRLQFGLP